MAHSGNLEKDIFISDDKYLELKDSSGETLVPAGQVTNVLSNGGIDSHEKLFHTPFEFLPAVLDSSHGISSFEFHGAELDALADLGKGVGQKDVNNATRFLSNAVALQTCMSTALTPSSLETIAEGSSDLSSLPGCVAKQIEEGRHNDPVVVNNGEVFAYFYNGNVDSLEAELGTESKDKKFDGDNDDLDGLANEIFDVNEASTGVGVVLEQANSEESTFNDDVDGGDLSTPFGENGLRRIDIASGSYMVLSGDSSNEGALLISNGDSLQALPLNSVVRAEHFPDEANLAPRVWQNPNFTWEGTTRHENS